MRERKFMTKDERKALRKSKAKPWPKGKPAAPPYTPPPSDSPYRHAYVIPEGSSLTKNERIISDDRLSPAEVSKATARRKDSLGGSGIELRSAYLAENKDLADLINASMAEGKLDSLDFELLMYRLSNPFSSDRTVADEFKIPVPEVMLRCKNPVFYNIRALFIMGPEDRLAEIRHLLRERLMNIVQSGSDKLVIEAAKVIEGAAYLASQVNSAASQVYGGSGSSASLASLPSAKEAIAILEADPARPRKREINLTELSMTIDVPTATALASDGRDGHNP